MKKSIILLFAVCFSLSLLAQNTPKKDKALFKEYKPGYYQNSILKGIEDYETKIEPPKLIKDLK